RVGELDAMRREDQVIAPGDAAVGPWMTRRARGSRRRGTALRDADAKFGTYIALCAFAGLRQGEASGLRATDIDFLRKEIRVCRQVQWTDDGHMAIRAPKHGSDHRVRTRPPCDDAG
ncbi:MAG TPA: hypothetical protein VGF65_11950, partial [Mycobacterium sp.]